MTNKHISQTEIFRRAAYNGRSLGLIMLLTVMLMFASATSPLASLMALAGLVWVPVTAYRLLRRSWLATAGRLSFSAVWLEGIVSFIFSSLIVALFVLIYLRWLDPDYLYRTMMRVILMAQTEPSLSGYSATFQKVIELHLIPTARDMALMVFWLVMASGSVFSLIITPVVRRPVKTPLTPASNLNC